MSAPSFAHPGLPRPRDEHARLLLRVEAALAASLDVEATLLSAAWLAVPQLADWCIVDLREGSGGWRRIAVAHGDPAAAKLAGEVRRRSPSLGSRLARAIEAREPVLVVPDEPDAERTLGGIPRGSVIAAPLVDGAEVRGLLTFVSVGAAAHDPSELEAARAFGELAGRALGAARPLPDEAAPFPTNATERAARLHAIAAAFADTVLPEEVADVALRQGMSALGARSGSVGVLSEDGTHVLTLRGLGYSPEVVAKYARVPLDERFPMTDAVRAAEPMFLGSFPERLARYPHLRSLAESNGGGAMAAVPLVTGGRPFGALGLNFGESRRFGPEERAFIETLARMCALALERTRLFEAERRARERLAVIADASRLLGTTLDFERTLRNVAAMAVPALADFCFFDFRQPDGHVRRIAHAHDDPAVQAILDGSRWVKSERTDLNLCALSSGATGFHADIDDRWRRDVATSPEHLEVLERLQLCSMITVPLSVDGDVYGALTLCHGRSGRHYSAADVPSVEELAHRASAAVQNARLLRQAKEAVSHRDAFLSIASHELNTPLTALMLQLTNFQRRPPPPERHAESMERALKQTRRLARLVTELLDVTRITEGRLRLERETFDLAALVRELVARLTEDGPTASPLSVRAPEPAMVFADRLRCEQVVTNLLSNALKYGAGKPVEVSVAAAAGRVQVAVRDHGIGIAPEQQQRLFQRFERAVSSRHYEGFGLGLWIVREIVEAHGGTVSLDTRFGEGSTFAVTFPCAG